MHWEKLLIIISGITILYGNLCAIPQRNLKRLLGYSSIAHAGYLLLGVAALTSAGQAAVLYYLSGYLFTTLAAFAVIALVMRHLDSEDISGLAATLTIAMVSLAGIPPLAGFFGKFLLLKAVIERGAANHGYYCLAFTALVGVVISLYYYFGVIRAIYFGKGANDSTPIQMSFPMKALVCVCLAGMFWLGLMPGGLLRLAEQATGVLSGAH
jgi:NADH-quinone oxidoreductase subunit N